MGMDYGWLHTEETQEGGLIMADILGDPVKIAMLVILIVMEVPAAVFLLWRWIKDNKERDNND